MAYLLTKPRQLAPTVGQGRLESIQADFSPSSMAVGSDCFHLQHRWKVHYRRKPCNRELDVTALTLADCHDPLCSRRRRLYLIVDLPYHYIYSTSLASPPPPWITTTSRPFGLAAGSDFVLPLPPCTSATAHFGIAADYRAAVFRHRSCHVSTSATCYWLCRHHIFV
jgi:hypothetical protein